MAHAPVSPASASWSFWPRTTLGWACIAAFGLLVASMVLVNVVHVRFLTWVLGLASLLFGGSALLVRKERSWSVAIVTALVAVLVLTSLVFLAGEAYGGHD